MISWYGEGQVMIDWFPYHNMSFWLYTLTYRAMEVNQAQIWMIFSILSLAILHHVTPQPVLAEGILSLPMLSNTFIHPVQLSKFCLCQYSETILWQLIQNFRTNQPYMESLHCTLIMTFWPLALKLTFTLNILSGPLFRNYKWPLALLLHIFRAYSIQIQIQNCVLYLL